MDYVKEAFERVKKDIDLLRDMILDIHTSSHDTQTFILDSLKNINERLNNLETTPTKEQNQIFNSHSKYYISSNPLLSSEDLRLISQPNSSTYPIFNPSSSKRQTGNSHVSVETEPKKLSLVPFYSPNPSFSTGNGGVQTDEQSYRPTVRQSNIPSNLHNKVTFVEENVNSDNNSSINPSDNSTKVFSENDFDKAKNILSTLDTLKLDIKDKFDSLTKQEMLIFTTLYSLENKGNTPIDYPLLAKTVGLTESSIRDYINKLQKKGIPIEKSKINNKKVVINIAESLKKVASLTSLLEIYTH